MKIHLQKVPLTIIVIVFVIHFGCSDGLSDLDSGESFVRIISPNEGQVLNFPIIVKLIYPEVLKIKKILFYIDDNIYKESNALPYECYLDVSEFADGRNHTLFVKMITTDETEVVSASVDVFIPETASSGATLIHPDNNYTIHNLSDLYLHWTRVANVKSYHYQVSTSENFSSAILENITNKNKANLSLLPFGTFFWRIRFNDLSGIWQDWGEPNKYLYEFFNGDFETGDFLGWILAGANESSIVIQNNHVYEGNYSAKLTLKFGDNVQGPRAEITKLDDSVLEKVRVYSWSFMIPGDYIEDDRWQMINQFHDYPNFFIGESWDNYPVKPPPIHINYHENECQLILRTTTPNHLEDTVGTFNIIKNQWFKIKYVIKWSETNGFVTLFVDDNPVTPFNGTDNKYYAPTVFNEVGNFLKIGLYRQVDIPWTNSVYVDDVFIGPN